MQFSARQLAETVNGQLEGNPDVLINGISKLDDSKPGTFSF